MHSSEKTTVSEWRSQKSSPKTLISYIWTEEDVFNQLTIQKITESIQRADTENVKQDRATPDNLADEAGTEGSQELTDDDYELIESFLENI